MILRVPLGVLVVLAVGCGQTHELISDADAGTDAHDGASRDAGVESATDASGDAACAPVREVSRECTARWARAVGHARGATDVRFGTWSAHRVADDVVAASLQLFDARVTLDGFALAGIVSFGLSPEGRVLWVYPYSWLLAVHDETPWLAHGSSDGYSIDVVRPADGVALRTIPQPGQPRTFSVGSCVGCATRWLTLFEWHDTLDLGPLGMRMGTHGWTVVAADDGGPLWEATSEVEGWWPWGRAVEPDGSSVVVWYGAGAVVPFCPVPGACGVGGGDPVVVAYDGVGDPIWSVVGTDAANWLGQRLDDGGWIVSRGPGVARIAADGSEIWRGANGAGSRWIAVDESRGVIWADVPIPTDGWARTIGDATVSDCGRVAGSYAHTTSIARLDLATGAVIGVMLPAEGLEIASVDIMSDGALLLAGHTHTRGDADDPRATIELCGALVAPDYGEATEIVVAVIDWP